MPWYLRGLVGIGAWLASVFFFIFIVMFTGLREPQQTTFGCMGIVLLIIAVIVGRLKLGLFVNQCALAVSLAAQAMLYYGFVNEEHPLGMTAPLSIGLAALLYFAYPEYLSRLITCIAALQITLVWIYVGSDGDPFSETLRPQSDLAGMITLYWALLLAGICWCFLRPRNSSSMLVALGHALLISITAWQIENLTNLWVRSSVIEYSPPWVFWLVIHFRVILTALTFFGVAVWAAGGLGVVRANAPLFAGLALALAALIWLGAGGVLLALLFMLLGFSLQSGTILGLGLILFPVFLTSYYYNLNLDLLAKAGVLAGSGLILLALRAGLQHLPWAAAKEAP